MSVHVSDVRQGGLDLSETCMFGPIEAIPAPTSSTLELRVHASGDRSISFAPTGLSAPCLLSQSPVGDWAIHRPPLRD